MIGTPNNTPQGTSTQDTTSSKQRLFSKLSELGLYTKDYEEFTDQFSSPEKQKKLYETLASDKLGNMVTIEQDAFISKYFPTAAQASPPPVEAAPDTATVEGVPFEQFARYNPGEKESTRSQNPFVNFGKTFWNVASKQLPATLEGMLAAGKFGITSDPQGDRFLAATRPSSYEALQDVIDMEQSIITEGRIENLRNAYDRMDEFQKSQEGAVVSLSDIDDSIDAINWVANSVGQAAAQIPASVLTKGFTSVGQEVGIIYMDQVKKIAEREDLTPEEVIEQGLDNRASAIAYGAAAGALDAIGARKATGILDFGKFKSDLARRAMSLLRAGSTEFATEGSQSLIEQFGAAAGSGESYMEAFTGLNLREAVDEAAAGAAGGGGIQVASQIANSVINKARSTPDAPKKSETIDKNIEAPDAPDTGDIETPQPQPGDSDTPTDTPPIDPTDIKDDGDEGRLDPDRITEGYKGMFPFLNDDILRPYAEREIEIRKIWDQVNTEGLPAHRIRNIPLFEKLYGYKGLLPGAGTLNRLNKKYKAIEKGYKRANPEQTKKEVAALFDEFRKPINITEQEIQQANEAADQQRLEAAQSEQEVKDSAARAAQLDQNRATAASIIESDPEINDLASSALEEPGVNAAAISSFVQGVADGKFGIDDLKNAFKAVTALQKYKDSVLEETEMVADTNMIATIAQKGVPKLAESLARNIKPQYREQGDQIIKDFYDAGLLSTEEYSNIVSEYDVNDLRTDEEIQAAQSTQPPADTGTQPGQTPPADSNAAAQQALEDRVDELQQQRDDLRQEDGSIAPDDLDTFRQLGKDITEAREAAKRGDTSDGKFIGIKERASTPDGDHRQLSGDDAVAAEQEIESIISRGIEAGKTPDEIMQEINQRYTFSSPEITQILLYMRDRSDSSIPEIGNNKQPFPTWRRGKPAPATETPTTDTGTDTTIEPQETQLLNSVDDQTMRQMSDMNIPQEEMDALQAPDYIADQDGAPVETGTPIRTTVYQGTGRQDPGSVYNTGAEGAILGEADYFALNERQASEFGDTVTEETVELTNPLVIDDDQKLAQWMMGDENAQVPLDNETRSQQREEFRRRVEEAGHDGVIVHVPKLADVNQEGEPVKRLREVFGSSQVVRFNKPAQQTPTQQQPPPTTAEPPEGQPGQTAENFRNVPLSEIETDVDRFQNRDQLYAEDTVRSIVDDVNDGILDPRDIPPILTWQDPADGNTYVVGGHSRLEAFRRLGLDTIQTQDVSRLTEEQAIERGRQDNALGTQESLLEQAKLVRSWMDSDMSQAEIDRRAKRLFQNNNRLVQAYAALNPNGKALQTVQQFQNNQTGDRTRVLDYAKYVGEARMRHDQLTDSHETELFNYLLESDNQNTKSQRAFLEFVDKIVDRNSFMGNLDTSKPLNIARVRPKSELEQAQNEELANAEKDFRNAQKDLANKIQQIEQRRADGDPISEDRADQILKKYQDNLRVAQRNVIQARKDAQATSDNARRQTNIFDTENGKDVLYAVDLPAIIDKRSDKGKSEVTMSRQAIVDFVIDKIGTAVGVGKAGGLRNAFGFYREGKPGNIIRLRTANDVMTLAHEVGHRLHHYLFDGNTHPEFDSELLPLGRATSRDSYSTEQVRKEGQAEFFRHLMLAPNLARQKATKYFEAFSQRLEEDPELQYAIDELYNMYNSYLNQDPVQQFESQIAYDDQSPTRRAKSDETWYQAIYRAVFVDNVWLDRMRRDLNPKEGADPKLFSRDAFRLGQLSKGIDSMLQSWLEFGVSDPDGNLKTKGLQDIYLDNDINTKEKRKNFDSYLIAKRALELYDQADAGKRELVSVPDDRGGSLGVTRQQAQAVVEKYGSPEFEKAAQELYAWNDAVLDWIVEREYMSEEQVDAVREMNRSYVPMNRIMDFFTSKSQGNKGAKLVDQPSLWKRINGSGRRIKPAVESLIMNTKSMLTAVENNFTALQAFDAIKNSENGGVWADPIMKPLKPVQSDLEAIQNTLINAGLDEEILETMDLGQVFTLWRPMRHNPQLGEVMIRRNGKTYLWQVHHEGLYDTLTMHSNATSNLLVRILTLPKAVFRHGVIMSLNFITGNTSRDQFIGHLNSRYGYATVHLNPFKKDFGSSDFLKGMAAIITKSENYRLWLQSKAGISGIVDQSRDTIGKTISQLGESKQEKIIKNLLFPTRWLQAVEAFSSVFENSSRVGEFIRGIESEGVSEEGLARAAVSSREFSGDFARGGDLAKMVGRYKAFFNAGLQGDLSIAQAIKRDPLGFMIRGVTTMTMLSLALNYLNKDNPDWQEREEERKQYWLFPLGNPRTTTDWFRLRKPWTMGTFFGTVLPEAVETAVTKEYDGGMDDLFENDGVAAKIIMDLMPNAVLPLIEVSAGEQGHVYFWNKSIDPYFDTELEPYLRYGGRNTTAEKMIGRAFNYSPRKIRHLIRGYTGTLGIEVNELTSEYILNNLQGLDKPPSPDEKLTTKPGLKPFFSPYLSANASESVQTFYKYMDQSRTALRSWKAIVNSDDQEAAEAYFEENENAIVKAQAVQRIGSIFTIHRDEIASIYESRELTPKQKREQLQLRNKEMIELAQMAVEIWEPIADEK